MAHSLRDLTYADAALVQGDITLTLGTGKDFNYFLPRIFESMAHDGLYLGNALPGALRKGREAGWSDEQWAAVVEFLRAFWLGRVFKVAG